ncbi:MAG: AI-2E family transporter [Hymenobacteraceae bacterium]|nr:AI-2E family transporter [Hymenobacteraceae bacterium]
MQLISQVRKINTLLLFLILLGFLLIVGRGFLYPILISMLIAYLLYPLTLRMERLGIPRILAILINVLLSIAIFIGAIYLIYIQLSMFLNDLPTLVDQANENIIAFENYLERKMEMKLGDEENWLQGKFSDFFAVGGEFLTTVFTATTSSVVKFGIMPIYIFLMLYYRNKFKRFLYKLIPAEKHEQVEHIIKEISFVTKRYMTGVVTVVLILCVLNSVGLLIVGLRYAILFGVLSALMNFIPYFGTLIGGAIPLTFSLLTDGSPKTAISIIILFLIIQFTENNILTPNITGGQVRINPMFTILSIVLGGMIWGLPGMIISVPFLGMFKIVCDHVKALQPYAYLLGTEGTEQHALTLKKIKDFFARLFRKK